MSIIFENSFRALSKVVSSSRVLLSLVPRVADPALHVAIAIKFLGEAEAAGPAFERPQLQVVTYMVEHVSKFWSAHLVANQANQRLLGTALGAHPLEVLLVEFINFFG